MCVCVCVCVCVRERDSPVEEASVRLLLGAPANQSGGSAPVQVVWGLEEHDIMHSSNPLRENKA